MLYMLNIVNNTKMLKIVRIMILENDIIILYKIRSDKYDSYDTHYQFNRFHT